MSDRVTILSEFGEVRPWLAQRCAAMPREHWDKFLGELEAGKRKLPVRIEEVMPRNRHDLIANPLSEPEEWRELELQKWEAWEAIWGQAPWRSPGRINPTAPRMGKFKS